MTYSIFTIRTYSGKYKMSIDINCHLYTKINEISHELVYLKIFDNIYDFIKEMKKYTKLQNFTFESEEKMNEAKEYVDSLLMMAKFSL